MRGFIRRTLADNERVLYGSYDTTRLHEHHKPANIPAAMTQTTTLAVLYYSSYSLQLVLIASGLPFSPFSGALSKRDKKIQIHPPHKNSKETTRTMFTLKLLLKQPIPSTSRRCNSLQMSYRTTRGRPLLENSPQFSSGPHPQ